MEHSSNTLISELPMYDEIVYGLYAPSFFSGTQILTEEATPSQTFSQMLQNVAFGQRVQGKKCKSASNSLPR